MNTCEKIQFELSLLDQDQPLSGPSERHLKDCADCRHFAAELSLQEFQLRALIYPTAPDWAGRIESALDTVAVVKVTPNRMSSARRERLFGKIALAVALSASLMVGVVGWLTSPFLNGLMAPAGPPMVAQGPEVPEPAVKSVAFGAGSKALNELGVQEADQRELGRSESGEGSIEIASASQSRSGQGTDGPAGSTGRDTSNAGRGWGLASPAPGRSPERFRKDLAAADSAGNGTNKDLMLRNQTGDAAILSVDAGFLEQLKKAEKPETMVRMVQNLCLLQFESVLDGLKDDDRKKATSNNQLDNTKTENAKQPPKTSSFDAELAGNNRAAPEDRASDTEPGRSLANSGDLKSKEMLNRFEQNQRSKPGDPWDERVRAQQELTDYKIAKLRENLPSPSHAQALKPLIEDLKNQHKELLRLASVHPGRAKVLTQLAEMIQNSVATLEKPVDSNAK